MSGLKSGIRTRRLTLETLGVSHAAPLYRQLRRDAIYRFIDERPPRSLGALEARYRFLARGRSPANRAERWLNWVIRLRQPSRHVGYVQATVLPKGDAYIGYVVSPRWWGRGIGREAVAAVIARLRSRGVRTFIATVDERNRRSIGLLERLGFRREGGEPRDLRFVLHPGRR